MFCLLGSDWTLPNKVEILVDILISFHVSGLKLGNTLSAIRKPKSLITNHVYELL